MNYMRVSQLPVMAALREIHAGPPLRLWGPQAKPRSPRQAGRKGGGSRKAMAFVRALASRGAQ